jgi:hypothetical protein
VDLAALTESDAARNLDWVTALRVTLMTTRRVFERHVREAEAPGGSLAEVLALKPHLARSVARLRLEHAQILQELASFVDELAAQADSGHIDAEPLQDRAVRMRSALRLHESRGTSLLYDAYFRDEGAS